MPTPQEFQKVIGQIKETAHKYGVSDGYFVGGYPRSIAMGTGFKDVHDLDVATAKPGRAKELAGFFAEAVHADEIYEHQRLTTVTVSVRDVEVDFQGSESHEHVRPYVRLWGIEETPLALNIFDRDFTMNSLAIPIEGSDLLDLTKRGQEDIDKKVVAAIIPPEVAVPHDPLMITRAIRMSVKYGFTIDPILWKSMKRYANMMENKLSPERLSIEAYVLSKYPQSKGLIDSLGITYLEAPKFIAMGKEEAEE